MWDPAARLFTGMPFVAAEDEAQPQHPSIADAEAGDFTGDNGPPPCSYCGNAEFGTMPDSGRTQRAQCSQCGGVMFTNGGQWQPELIGDPDNHPSTGADPASGGVGGAANAIVMGTPEVRTTDEGDRTASLDPAFSTWHVAGYDSYGEWDGRDDDEDEERTSKEWDERHPHIEEMHRGVGVMLPDELHHFVHDRSKPLADRAHALLEHVSHGNSITEGVGRHWTDDENIAHGFARDDAGYRAGQDKKQRRESGDFSWGHEPDDHEIPHGKPATQVVLHSAQPPRESIDHNFDPNGDGSGAVYGYDEHGESEIPIHHGASVPIKGITFKQHKTFDDETPEDWNDDGEHHDFAETMHRSAKESLLHTAISWDEIGDRHPHVYGDSEIHGEDADGADGPGIGDAANYLAHERESDPDAENSSVHDLDFHEEHVHPRHIDYNPSEANDYRVTHAREGYQQHPDKMPPLVLVHRHGVYQVADGHHRAQAADSLDKPVKAYVAHSPYPDEPFRDGEKAPFYNAVPTPLNGGGPHVTQENVRDHLMHDHGVAAKTLDKMNDNTLGLWHETHHAGSDEPMHHIAASSRFISRGVMIGVPPSVKHKIDSGIAAADDIMPHVNHEDAGGYWIEHGHEGIPNETHDYVRSEHPDEAGVVLTGHKPELSDEEQQDLDNVKYLYHPHQIDLHQIHYHDAGGNLHSVPADGHAVRTVGEATEHDYPEEGPGWHAQAVLNDEIPWCAHLYHGNCTYPGDKLPNGTILGIPQDRGPCPWKRSAFQQAACPISDPGPMAVMQVSGGKSGELPEGLTFDYKDRGDSHKVMAIHPQGGQIGQLTWYKNAHPGHHRAGEVDGIEVDPGYQRRGVASAMWDHARSLNVRPQPRHSTEQTGDGTAWAAHVGVIAGQNGELPENFRVEYADHGGLHHLRALDGDTAIGGLTWLKHGNPNFGVEPGEVHNIWTDEGYKRRGVASALWNAAHVSDLEPKPVHTPGEQSEDGSAWARHVGAAQ